jgi:endonuclease YncB( thermonuclease family)
VAKAVYKTSKGFTVGIGQLGLRDGAHGSVDQEVHDGDTLNVDPVGNLSVRFLGVDAPEVSFTLPEQAIKATDGRPGEATFVEIGDPRWEAFLSDPFSDSYGSIELEPGLRADLQARVGPGTAANHATLAGAATAALRSEVSGDMQRLSQDSESFSFFLAFASEVMDGYGRFLAFINCNQEKPPRPPSYNERLLRQGQVTPYFIWPNLDPFRRQPLPVDAVPEPGKVTPPGAPAEASKPLDDARAWVRKAREDKLGVWSATEPLRLFPFELRFLSRRTPPDRWVIDLSAEDDRLLAPQLYHQIANPEDRLYIPGEYVPLFEAKGWKATRT